MNTTRRTFLKQSASASAAIAIDPFPLMKGEVDETKEGSKEILKQLSLINDERIEALLLMQVSDPSGRWNGGVKNSYQLPNAHSTCWFIVYLGQSYASPFSKYYLNESLEEPVNKAMECLLRVQHDDGTIDLHSTNFHSTPDTAFIVNYLHPVYQILNLLKRPGLRAFTENAEAFFLNAGKCLVNGGVHTPNHRWVVCAALARVHSLFPDQKYIDRADEWLSEGIDMDPDGQYTEKSVSIYSPVCDNMLLTVARLLNRPRLFDVVRKNLNMTLYYIQPGGEVLTEASGRQDSGRIGYVDRYYYACRFFAIRDQNPVYAAVCRLIETRMPEKIIRYILPMMENPVFEQQMASPTAIPEDYFRRFGHSGVFRIRRGKTDLSVIENNPTFLTFMKGQAVLQSLRLHASFFGGRGQFASEKAMVEGEKIVLTRSLTHGYYQPLPAEKITGNGDWSKMPHNEREVSEKQTLHYKISIQESEGKVTVETEIEGTPHVPVSMELSFREGGVLTGVVPDEHSEDGYFLEEGIGEYRLGDDVVAFGPGKADHRWGRMRGMFPKQPGDSVFITGFTPFKHRIGLT